MESTPISIEIASNDLPPSPSSCPISSLLGKRIVDMTEEELTEHVMKLRTAREVPQAMRALLSGKPKAAKAAKTKAKPDLSVLDL